MSFRKTKIAAFVFANIGATAGLAIADTSPTSIFELQDESAWRQKTKAPVDIMLSEATEDLSPSMAMSDPTKKALGALIAFSHVSPSTLSSIAANMKLPETEINAFYLGTVATRIGYEEAVRSEIAKWCQVLETVHFPEAATLRDIGPYQQTLENLDTLVLSAVESDIDRLAAEYPAAYEMATANFNFWTAARDPASIDPVAWVKDHKLACSQFGS